MSASPKVALGVKFGVLAIASPRAKQVLGSLHSLGDRSAISTQLPEGALETWRDGIGRFQSDQLAGGALFLWAHQPSESPEVLDAENESLVTDAWRLYLGLLLAVPYFSSDRIFCMTGANADGTPRVRSFTTYPRTYSTLGSPILTITAHRARFAHTLADAIRMHESVVGGGRFVRTLRTFREACESPNVDQRLHQFVRCAEGFVAPPFKQSGKQFAKRLKRICAGSAVRQLEELYSIRGGIEHLHGPFDRIKTKVGNRPKWARLLLRCVQAEALARYLLTTYLLHPAVWPMFLQRDTIDAFWGLRPAEFRNLWPSRMHFPSIAKEFDTSALHGVEIGR